MTSHLCPRRRRPDLSPRYGAVHQQMPERSYAYNAYSNTAMPVYSTGTVMPMTPPPPYDLRAGGHFYNLSPVPIYPSTCNSRPHLPPHPPDVLWQQHSRWSSTVSLPIYASQQDQALQAAAVQPIQDMPVGVEEGAMARHMNQGAALCDRVASRLNDVLAWLESQDASQHAESEQIDSLVQGLDIEESEKTRDLIASQPKQRRRKPSQDAKGGIINFKKTWMYANSRLPPHMLPLKVYIPTWQILCRAADASAAVYNRPRSNEGQEYVEADWRQGTKAMALKSVCLDEKNLIVFAIRGSKWNLVDWAVNFRPAPKEPVGFLDDQGNACHAGFLQVAKAMIAPVAARLRQLLEQNPCRSGSSLVMTGHSAGGAVASLLYKHMLSTSTESELNILTGCFRRVHCVTFGAPPVTLLPLQKPNDEKFKKNIFMAFANEGDPIVRADKQYLYCLARLIAAPTPEVSFESKGLLKTKQSTQKLKKASTKSTTTSKVAPVWPVPEATLSNAGRLVLLRYIPAQQKSVEAVCLSDEQLRNVIFGDPSMHDMAMYKRRIDELAVSAVTGRD